MAQETAATSSMFPASALPWQSRLAAVVDLMREMSSATDPQSMVRRYTQRMSRLVPMNRRLSLSRRGLQAPELRITRYSGWEDEVNPWKQPERLPLVAGGILGELIYANEPRLFDDLKISSDDPAAEYLAGHRSLVAIPLFDRGEALNMFVGLRREPGAFDPEELPQMTWMSNLFGRATQNLVLADQLEAAYRAVDHELKIVADIQRSLLPQRLPEIPGVRLAAEYRTSRRAGGDYYDFFPLPDGKWGVLIADVSGHGTPAAVVMAITHSIAHGYPGPPTPPGELLSYLNAQLARHYTGEVGSFVTAFYGIYDPAARRLEYANAGHNPPRVKHCRRGTVSSLDQVGHLPLGIDEAVSYPSYHQQLERGDRVVLYTDGITEALNPAGQQFGSAGLDAALEHCGAGAEDLLARVLAALAQFTAGCPAVDDQTLVLLELL